MSTVYTENENSEKSEIFPNNIIIIKSLFNVGRIYIHSLYKNTIKTNPSY